MPRIRRYSARLAAALVLGLGTSVVVSWALAALVVPDRGAWSWRAMRRPNDGSGHPDLVDICRYSRPGCSHYEVLFGAHGPGPPRETSWGEPLAIEAWARPWIVPWEFRNGGSGLSDGRASESAWPEFVMPANIRYAVVAHEATAYGFPFPCLFHHVHAAPGGAAVRYVWTRKAQWLVPGTTSPAVRQYGLARPVALPLRPIPWALAADSAVYAVVWLAVLAVPGAVRRAIRRRRGGCESCGYDLRATAPGLECPECGAAPWGGGRNNGRR